MEILFNGASIMIEGAFRHRVAVGEIAFFPKAVEILAGQFLIAHQSIDNPNVSAK